MEIIFKTRKLQKLANHKVLSVRGFGEIGAMRLGRRLDEIRAAENLATLMTLPQARCHPLKGDLKGKFAVDLHHPQRLILEPANDPVPHLEDGGIDASRVTTVRVLKVEDYHG